MNSAVKFPVENNRRGIYTIHIRAFLKCFTEFSEFITVKGLEPATRILPSASQAHVRDRIFKLRPVYVSVIYQIL